jgi:hypothetical protein
MEIRLFATPPVYWRCACKGESPFDHTHSGRILPDGQEGVNRQVYPLSPFLD